MEDKKSVLRFAARCRDQDRQYEINNNGEVDNGVCQRFVYSSRDGNPDPSSSVDDGKDRMHSSRNDTERGNGSLKGEIERRVREGKRVETEITEDYGEESDSLDAIDQNQVLDPLRVQTLVNFGYPEEYVKYCLLENEANYCLSGYFLLGEGEIQNIK